MSACKKVRQKKVAPPKKKWKWCCTSACMALTGLRRRAMFDMVWMNIPSTGRIESARLFECTPCFQSTVQYTYYEVTVPNWVHNHESASVETSWLYGRRFEISHPCYYTHRWSTLGETSDEYLRRIDSFRFNVFSTDKGNSVLCLYANAQYN